MFAEYLITSPQRSPSLAGPGMWRSSLKTRQYVLAAVFVLATAVYFHSYIALYSQYPSDDAYIHFRIARNFVEHGQPYYNIGQPVSGSSSFLWTLLISAMFAVAGVHPENVPYADLAFTLVAFALCAVLFSRRFSMLASAALAFVIVTVFLLGVAAQLMETPAALSFFLASLLCLQRNRFVAFGLFSALALLVRYEFAAWLLIGFLLAPGAASRRRYVIGGAFPLLFLLVSDYYFFSTVIPNTVFAKAKLYQLNFKEFLSLAEMEPWAVVPFAVASAVLLYEATRPDTPAWAKGAAFFPLLLLGLYAVTRTFLFQWYVPLILLPLAVAMCALLRDKKTYAILLLLAAIHRFPASAMREAYGLLVRDPSQHPSYAEGARTRQYLHIGTDLSALFPDAVLMTPEVGALGWTFRGRVIDAAGLISPECLKYHPMKVPEERSSGSIGAIPPQAVRDLSPQLVVSMEVFSEAFRRELAAGTLGGYALLRNYPVLSEADSARSGRHVLWGSRNIQVYVREPDIRSLGGG
jgi:hypothetical protein